MRYILIFFLMVYTSQLFAQKSELEGLILDAKTNEPISFAHIAIKGTSIGSISNEEGAFILSFSNAIKADSIIFSHVSYESASYLISSFLNEGIIKLTPLVIRGAEITIVDISDHITITTTVEKLLANDIGSHLLKGFYRKTSKTDTNYTQAIEAFYWVEYGTYSFEDGNRQFLGIQDKILKEGRVAEAQLSTYKNTSTTIGRTILDDDEATFNIKNYQQYLGFPIALSENSNLLALPLATDYHKFYSGERVAIIGDSIGVFSFKPKPVKLLKRLFYLQNHQKVDSAYAYINLNNYQLVRYNGWFSSIPGITDGEEVLNLIFEFDYRFRKNGLPESISLNSFSPKMKFKNRSGKNYEIANVEIKSTLVFYDFVENYNPITFAFTSPFLSIKDDSKSLANSIYKPKFWEENQWLKRTPAEAFVSFMQKNGLFRVYN